jgi:hypothetical protein
VEVVRVEEQLVEARAAVDRALDHWRVMARNLPER